MMRDMYCTGWFSHTGFPPFKIRGLMVYGEERLVAPQQPDVERTSGADQGAIRHVKLVARHGGQDVASAVNSEPSILRTNSKDLLPALGRVLVTVV